MIISTIANGIQSGANTNHHDHVITLVSFSTMNAIDSNPVKPVPVVILFIKLCLLFCCFVN